MNLTEDQKYLVSRFYNALNDMKQCIEDMPDKGLGAIVTVSYIAPLSQWPTVDGKVVHVIYRDES